MEEPVSVRTHQCQNIIPVYHFGVRTSFASRVGQTHKRRTGLQVPQRDFQATPLFAPEANCQPITTPLFAPEANCQPITTPLFAPEANCQPITTPLFAPEANCQPITTPPRFSPKAKCQITAPLFAPEAKCQITTPLSAPKAKCQITTPLFAPEAKCQITTPLFSVCPRSKMSINHSTPVCPKSKTSSKQNKSVIYKLINKTTLQHWHTFQH